MMLHIPIRRCGRLVAASLLLLLLLPAGALGHSELKASDPANKATVPSPYLGPIVLTFTEELATGSKADLQGPGGTHLANDPIDPAKNDQMSFTFDAPLAPGAYKIEWTSVADDGDLLRGIIDFTVAAAPSPSPTAVPTAAPSAAPSAAASATPTPLVTPPPSTGPTPVPSGDGSNTGGTSDVILPIVIALIVLAAGAAYLLSRRNRPADPT